MTFMSDEFRFAALREASGLLCLADLEQVVARLRAGGLAVLPTETGHMLAAAVTSGPALRAAFTAKQRDTSHPMHIACSSLEMADVYAELNEEAKLLLGRFTPGPLTAIVGQRDSLPGDLVTLRGTVGIRIPDHPATMQVIAALGVPVTATSLNRSGEESGPADISALAHLEWGGLGPVFVVNDPAAVRFSRPSTLVRLTAGTVEILRSGPISLEEIENVLKGSHDAP
jgi:L-threonylcarbamoyladenylate synthase